MDYNKHRLKLLTVFSLVVLFLIVFFVIRDESEQEQNFVEPNLINSVMRPEDSSTERHVVATFAYTGVDPHVDFWKKIERSLYEYAKTKSVVIIDYSGNDFSVERQKENIIQASKDGVDGIIIGPVSDEVVSAIDYAQFMKVPVVTIGSALQHPWIATQVVTDDQKSAEMAAARLTALLKAGQFPGKKVFIVSGDTSQVNAHVRAEVPATALRKMGYDVEIYFSPGWSGPKCLQFLLPKLQKYDDIACLYGTFAPASVAIVEASEHYSLNVLLVGFDLNQTMEKMILSGRLNSAIAQNPEQMSITAIDVLLSIKNGQKTESFISPPTKVITREFLLESRK